MHDEGEAEVGWPTRSGPAAPQEESAVAREVAQRIQHAIGPCTSARVRRTAVRWTGHGCNSRDRQNNCGGGGGSTAAVAAASNKENTPQHTHDALAVTVAPPSHHTACTPAHAAIPASSRSATQVHHTPAIDDNNNVIDACEMPAGVEGVLRAMDPTQRAAACFASDAALLIQAGAGSGKTQTMAARVAVLLARGVPARAVLGICFTRQAAETLRERVRAVLPAALRHSTQFLKLKTLHAFALECLRRFGRLEATTEVYDAGRQRRLARRVVAAHATQQKSAEAVEQLVEYVNRVKTKSAARALESYTESQSAYLYPHYQYELHEVCKAIDFGDLLQLFLELLRSRHAMDGAEEIKQNNNTTRDLVSREDEDGEEADSARAILRRQYSHIVVDEFQDLNEVQLEILAQLAGPACRVTCVGDPNQCIYAWRGAVPEVFALWCRRFPHTTLHTLGMNYRSDGTIVALTNQLVRARQTAWRSAGTHQQKSTSDAPCAARRAVLITCETDMEELEALPYVIEELLPRRNARLQLVHSNNNNNNKSIIHYHRMAVLCRTRRRVQACCDYLRRRGIPVRELKRVLPDAISPVRALLAYLRVCLAPHGDDEEVRVALCVAPVHLASKTAKAFFFALDAVCQARRQQQQQQQSQVPSTARQSSEAGSAAEAADYYTLLRELVYHDFSADAFPKLQLGKAGQKVIRHFVRITRRAQDMLRECANSNTTTTTNTTNNSNGGDGVEQVLRYVCEEGGFAAPQRSSSSLLHSRGGSRGGVLRGKRARSVATGAALADSVAAELSTAPLTNASAQLPTTTITTSTSSSNNNNNSNGAGGQAMGEEVVYTPAEETALLAGAQGGSVTQLLLDAYRTVEASVAQEACAASSSDSTTEMHHERRDKAKEGLHTAPAALMLRRVIDELTTVVPTDNFGQLRFPTDPVVAQQEEQEEGQGDKTEEARREAQGRRAAVKTEVTTATSSPNHKLSHIVASSTRREGDVCGDDDSVPEDNCVTVTTVHQAKGMEWPAVVVPGCWVGEFPVRAKSEEEKRVFYVALSRAMSDLVLLTARHDAREDDVESNHNSNSNVLRVAAYHGTEGGVACSNGVNGGGEGRPHTEHGLQRCPYLTALEKDIDALSFAELKEQYLRHRGQL